MKTHDYNDILNEELKTPSFRREYEALEGEFTVAKEIIRLRKARGWTQKELAERARTSQPAIARLESGNYRNVTLSFLRRVGEALDAVPVVSMHVVRGGSAQHA
ncbi:MAG: helix-turn-helix transcriptional regulator [Lentisphaerae bacterium]|nr:helix-turn-helix transcriptional regulator [Lentisphaerota bacterium]